MAIAINEPHRQEAYEWTSAPSENSDQPAHSHNLIRILARRVWVVRDAKFLRADS